MTFLAAGLFVGVFDDTFLTDFVGPAALEAVRVFPDLERFWR